MYYTSSLWCTTATGRPVRLIMTRRAGRTVCHRLGLPIRRVLRPLRWCQRPTGLLQPLIDRACAHQHPHATAAPSVHLMLVEPSGDCRGQDSVITLKFLLLENY
jgi:hypothetical protein